MHPPNPDDPFTFLHCTSVDTTCPLDSNELMGTRRRSSDLGVQLDHFPMFWILFQLRFARAIWNSERSAIERHGAGKCKPQVPFR